MPESASFTRTSAPFANFAATRVQNLEMSSEGSSSHDAPLAGNQPSAKATAGTWATAVRRVHGAGHRFSSSQARRPPSSSANSSRSASASCASPHRRLSTKSIGSVGDTGVEPVTSCVSCKRANQLRQSPSGRLTLAPRPLRLAGAGVPHVAGAGAGRAVPGPRFGGGRVLLGSGAGRVVGRWECWAG